MITVNELFSGIGTQSLAFKYLGIPHKVVGMAEIDKNAIKAYETLHGETRNYGDVSEVDKLDYADFWTYSFPCFTADTNIFTITGNKKIVDVEVGDLVLTHMGRFRRVKNTFKQGKKKIWKVKTCLTKELRTTENHKFYTMQEGEDVKPVWKELKDITNEDYMCVMIGTVYRADLDNLENTDQYLKSWVKAEYIIETDEIAEVYDIEVEEDHSMIANGVVAHNCQDLSSGGKGAGLEKGTRSGLLWEVERLLEKSVELGEAPKFLLLENVPDLVRNKKHKKGLDKWLDKLVELGYDNYYCVVNSADCGVPQNRERLFVVSTRKDLEREIYFFNINKQPLVGFKNFVEDWVNEYSGPLMIDSTISPYLIDNFTRDIEKMSHAIDIPIWTCECKSGFQDNRVGIWYSPTIRHQNTHTAIFYNNQIHKLTAREAWRFMGIRDEDYQKVEDTGMGKTSIYGLAGNAIVVNVLMEIYKLLFIKGVDY